MDYIINLVGHPLIIWRPNRGTRNASLHERQVVEFVPSKMLLSLLSRKLD